MIKYLKFYLLNRLVKNPVVTAQIYNMMYQDGTVPKLDIPYIPPVEMITSVPKIEIPKNRKQQLQEGLDYLKSKVDKTKQDKESIGIIEAALKNER